ncbi:MAG: hypothetical protein ACRDA4_10510 [Filifactoraceae bacterium]
MAIKVFPVNSVNNEPLYDARDFRLPFRNFFTNGIFLTPGDPINSYSFNVTAKTGMTITIKKGTAFINGLIFQMDADIDITLDIGDSLARRYDSIAIQMDETLRRGSIVVKKGTASDTPNIPGPTRNNDIFELIIAYVYVNQGETSLNQSKIYDTRTRDAICGIVHGAVSQVDTEEFYQQYLASLQQQRASQQDTFNTFINSYKNTISGIDPGGKVLTEMVDARQGKANLLENMKAKDENLNIAVQSMKDYSDSKDRRFEYFSGNGWHEFVETVKNGITVNGVTRDLKILKGKMTYDYFNGKSSKHLDSGIYYAAMSAGLSSVGFSNIIYTNSDTSHWANDSGAWSGDNKAINLYLASTIRTYAYATYPNHYLTYEVIGWC